jgi:hypothetical protein
MEAYLLACGLWNAVAVSVSDTDDSNKSSKSEQVVSSDVKSHQAYSILLQSFNKKQLQLVKQVPVGNAAAAWKNSINISYPKNTHAEYEVLQKSMKNKLMMRFMYRTINKVRITISAVVATSEDVEGVSMCKV